MNWFFWTLVFIFSLKALFNIIMAYGGLKRARNEPVSDGALALGAVVNVLGIIGILYYV